MWIGPERLLTIKFGGQRLDWEGVSSFFSLFSLKISKYIYILHYILVWEKTFQILRQLKAVAIIIMTIIIPLLPNCHDGLYSLRLSLKYCAPAPRKEITFIILRQTELQLYFKPSLRNKLLSFIPKLSTKPLARQRFQLWWIKS